MKILRNVFWAFVLPVLVFHFLIGLTFFVLGSICTGEWMSLNVLQENVRSTFVIVSTLEITCLCAVSSVAYIDK